MSLLTKKEIESFQMHILSYYQDHGRFFAWRKTGNPYHILVSEIMLQQTQTDRVISKYEAFLQAFPTIQNLADAPLRLILSFWQGLGYNRRALALHKAAQIIVQEKRGVIPNSTEQLQQLPGIGPYTAGAICAFAFNMPTVFIETNIRAVFIHFFFKETSKIHDKNIRTLVKQTLYQKDPRSWYYALMDYGVLLKKKTKNPNKKSIHYTVQSKFKGSNREIRGTIIRLLTKHLALSYEMIIVHLNIEPERIKKIIYHLCSEGLLKENKGTFFIPN